MNLVICDYKYRSNYKRRSFNRFNGYCWYCAFCFSGTIIKHRYIDIEFSRMNSFQFQLRILYGYGSEMATGRVFCPVLCDRTGQDRTFKVSILYVRNYSNIKTSQVEHSGHRIPHDPAGKMRESHRIP